MVDALHFKALMSGRMLLELKHIRRQPKRLADGTIKFYYCHRKSGDQLDENNLVQSYAAAEKKAIRSEIW